MRFIILLVLLDSFFLCIFSGWVDPDTAESHYELKSYVNGEKNVLIFSDEFNVEGRNFANGMDPRWTAMNKNDYTNFALQYYNEKLITTSNGRLNISTVYKDITFSTYVGTSTTESKMTKNYQSGMVQGWNKFCFTGGIVEVSAKLPGSYNIGGLWPAIWLLGNLARATYVGSSNNMWPWSYNKCDRALQLSQLISACNVVNHYNMQPHEGRGAPEVDILEVMPGEEKLVNTPINKPYFSASYQVAPAIQDFTPTDGSPPWNMDLWYHNGISYGTNTSLNIFFYGEDLISPSSPKLNYRADAISANHQIGATHFETFHTYRLEWMNGPDGYLNCKH